MLKVIAQELPGGSLSFLAGALGVTNRSKGLPVSPQGAQDGRSFRLR